MQFIGILLVLLAVGWLTMTQLNKPSPEETTVTTENGTIKAPQTAQELKQFEQDVNAMVQQNAEQQRQQLEQLESQQ